MEDLATWLLVQYDVDEKRSHHTHEAGCFSSWWEHDRLGYDVKECNCDVPTTLRADLAVKRRIVDIAVNECGAEDWLMQMLALPYAAREGYDPSWALDLA